MVARGIDAAIAVRCLDAFVRPPGADDADLLQSLTASLPPDGEAARAVAEVQRSCAYARRRPPPAAFGWISSLARGLSYYTGAIMEIAVPDLAGSLGGGGRYDNLIGMFLGRDVPACGFSLGLERIIVVMTERKMFPDRSRAAPST